MVYYFPIKFSFTIQVIFAIKRYIHLLLWDEEIKGLIFYDASPHNRASFALPFSNMAAQCLHMCCKKGSTLIGRLIWSVYYFIQIQIQVQILLSEMSLGHRMVSVCVSPSKNIQCHSIPPLNSPSMGRNADLQNSQRSGTRIYACTWSPLNAKQIINSEYNSLRH